MNQSEQPRVIQRPMLCVALVLAAYVLASAWFYPTVLTVSDETAYMRQGWALSHGATTVEEVDAATGERLRVAPSDYPPGTALLLAPLMAVGGWRSGFLLGAFCCVATTLVLASMLRQQGRSPLWALLFVAYPPTLVISRSGMSDLPTALFVAVGLHLFLSGESMRHRFAAGFAAGCTLLFRETAPLLFVFMFLGALLRRERALIALVLGGLVGVALRLAASMGVYGDALFLKQTHPGFSLAAVGENAWLYAIALMVFVPCGFALALAYRGARRQELLCTLIAFTLLHLFYTYSGASSGGLKQLVLGPRFFIPLLPILILAMAESGERLWAALLARLGVEGRVRALAALRLGAAALALAVAAEAVLTGYALARWQTGQRAIVIALYASTEPGTPVATNLDATRKYVNELYAGEFGERIVDDFATLDDARVEALLGRHGRITLALLTRRDSEHWRHKAAQNQARVEALGRAYIVNAGGSTVFADGEKLEVFTLSKRP